MHVAPKSATPREFVAFSFVVVEKSAKDFLIKLT
jgi:hypothetical protein